MTHRSLENDIAWLLCIHRDDEKALACLMRKYYAALYLFAATFTTNEEIIKKCIHEVFKGLWQKRFIADKILLPQDYLLKSTKDKLKQCLEGGSCSTTIFENLIMAT